MPENKSCRDCPLGSCGDHCQIDFERGLCRYDRMSHYELLEAKYKRLEHTHKNYVLALGGQLRSIFESAARYGYYHGVGGNLLDGMYQAWLEKEGKHFAAAIEEAVKK